jgi:hypothetical protein
MLVDNEATLEKISEYTNAYCFVKMKLLYKTI